MALTEKATRNLIGFSGIYPDKVNNIEEVGLGYRLGKNYWGRGLATESNSAVVADAFGKKKIPSIVAIIKPEHDASIKVVRKIGFRECKTIEYSGSLANLYRINRNDWKN